MILVIVEAKIKKPAKMAGWMNVIVLLIQPTHLSRNHL
jgi:hypothetical protein